MNNSTVAAISTPYGKGGIAVIRISGEEAFSVADKVFFPVNGKDSYSIRPNEAVFGNILHEGKIIDTGLATYFKGPRSFTGEDTVEISCHGGILLSSLVLEAVLCAGAVPAGPGEFTKRAFLAGKMSLSQAEAVIELIDAESREKLMLASAQTGGRLSREIDSIYSELLELVSSAYVYIDFPDEDLNDISSPEILERLSEIIARAEKLLSSYRSGKAINEGIKTVIVGRPNTGKSSVLNSILGEDRAIVTELAGTTRDTIEEKAVVGKIILNLCDTAGIRNNTEDRVESLGIERSVKKLEEAELVIAVFDSSVPLTEEDESFIEILKERAKEKSLIALLNKCDLEKKADTDKIRRLFENTVEVSAKENIGMDKVKELCEKLFVEGDIDYSSTAVISNARQNASLRSAVEKLVRARDALLAGHTQDIACFDIEGAMEDISELDGRQISEELVNNIFHRFCVGK
ncbi:MAG: tRNA uridine-5-carboxymethylaminomethyl(34) synthesis GTPase MnmE [Ruminococcaceae bacterium]|nr:tRNA uridine-5-carboxymethylaminomethyl(34) synthesis GTPase MnmE [Oscillospiraceae bacterium]